MRFDVSSPIGVLGLFLLGTFQNVSSTDNNDVLCRDESGNAVDWFYMYKLPKHYAADPHASSSAGYTYIYLTSAHHSAWQFGGVLVNDSGSLPGMTLQPLYSNTANTLLLAYNDEYPNGTTYSNGGHTKGVFGTNGYTGFWLIHSVPHYPAIGTGIGANGASNYSYPSSGTTYGQSFLCVSMNTSAALNNVGVQLQFMEPHFYSERIPRSLSGMFPAIEQAIAGIDNTKPPFNNSLILEGTGNFSFLSFAKGERFGSDLYADWMAPTLGVTLLVEAWRDGGGNLPSNCTLPHDDVFNVLAVEQKDMGIGFNTTKDHSKWAVSERVAVHTDSFGRKVKGFFKRTWRLLKKTFGGSGDVGQNEARVVSSWICVGDINRQQGQLQRGGGSVCLPNLVVAKLYRNMVAQYEPCSGSDVAGSK